jgi:hypothetical protein
LNRTASFVSTGFNWLLILLLAAIMWEIAKNLWANWGTSSFWLSTLCAAAVGVLVWWAIGLILYLAAPRSVAQTQPQPNPTMKQSIGNVSGGSSVNQAGGNITINQGVSEDTLRQIINQKAVSAHAELSARYPMGYVILGVADGNIVYNSTHAPPELEVDWKSAEIRFENGSKKILIPNVRIGNAGVGNCKADFSFLRPGMNLVAIGDLRLGGEVLDEDKSIVVIGLKPKK